MKNLLAHGQSDLVTVVVAEVVPRRWWEHILHNKTALFIRTAFLFTPTVVVTSVPYLVGRAYRWRDLYDHDDAVDATLNGRTDTAAAGVTEPSASAVAT